MGPLPIIALLVVGAFALASKKSSSNQAATAASEVPTDANGLLATMLAPSLVNLDTLKQIYASFMTAAENQYDINKTSSAPARLAQYALATFLKASVLAKGAQPDPNELMLIAYAPTAGGAGLIGYGDTGVDRQTAIANALNAATTSGALGSYIGALATAYNTTAAGPGRRRLLAYILAAKARQVALSNAVKFPDAEQFDPPVFFAIANLKSADIPATTNPNSIVSI